MGMELGIGTKVKIRKSGGGILRGVIKSLSMVPGRPTEYGVKLDSGALYYYQAHDLVKDTDNEMSWECTCGAKKAHEPYPAPGHAHHCDISKLKGIWT